MLGAALRSASSTCSGRAAGLPGRAASSGSRCSPSLAEGVRLPLASRDADADPLRPLGLPRVVLDVVQGLLEDGPYTNYGVPRRCR